ncbi:MAG: LysM peptidoglycan-binding domain-containing protein [Elusimicrobiota bacterium]
MNRQIPLLLTIILFLPVLLNAKLVEVEVRTGDTLHGFASKYLKNPSEWPKIYDINKKEIKNPNKIYPGQIINIPIEMLKDKVGDLTGILNSVKVKKREKRDWNKGKKNETLFPEDGILTGDKSFARIDFLVGSNLKINENSLIYLKPTKAKTAVASLLEGGLNVNKAKIITPAAEILPRGNSQYDVDIDKEKNTKVSVRLGEVDVKAQGETVTVIQGFRTMVEFSKAPQSPVALPLAGEEALEFKEDILSNKELIFYLEVSGDEEFNILAKKEETSDLGLDHIKEGLKPGQYYWRAAIIDKHGFRGDFSRARAFVVQIRTSAVVELTGFEIVNKDEGIMRIAGYATNASRVVVNGYPTVIDQSGNFKTTIVLSKGQHTITVTAISSEGIIIRKYHRSEDGMWLPAE